jgi:hypothetical protein
VLHCDTALLANYTYVVRLLDLYRLSIVTAPIFWPLPIPFAAAPSSVMEPDSTDLSNGLLDGGGFGVGGMGGSKRSVVPFEKLLSEACTHLHGSIRRAASAVLCDLMRWDVKRTQAAAHTAQGPNAAVYAAASGVGMAGGARGVAVVGLRSRVINQLCVQLQSSPSLSDLPHLQTYLELNAVHSSTSLSASLAAGETPQSSAPTSSLASASAAAAAAAATSHAPAAHMGKGAGADLVDLSTLTGADIRAGSQTGGSAMSAAVGADGADDAKAAADRRRRAEFNADRTAAVPQLLQLVRLRSLLHAPASTPTREALVSLTCVSVCMCVCACCCAVGASADRVGG